MTRSSAADRTPCEDGVVSAAPTDPTAGRPASLARAVGALSDESRAAILRLAAYESNETRTKCVPVLLYRLAEHL